VATPPYGYLRRSCAGTEGFRLFWRWRRPCPSGRGAQTQTWSTFLRNHAREVLACDFFVTVTAVHVFVVLDISTRRLVHWNATEHPTAEWTAQQFRTCVTGDDS
jgi:putative transposase